ncbi:MAG: T9SS type A sorting domain-containing protein [Ignavibacteria bacterium]
MKKSVFTFLLLLCVSSSYSQWITNYGFSEGDINFTNAKGNAVTTDASGYSYVTGYTYDTQTQNDIVTIKYTPTGDTVWVRSYNGTSNQNDEGTGICVDAQGNVYVVGFAEISGKSLDVMLIKYTSDGAQQWAIPYSKSTSAFQDKGTDIAVDANGYIYITGFTTDDSGIQNIFTRKCDPNGNEMWSKLESGLSHLNSQGSSIVVSNAGNVYVTGYVTIANGITDIAVVSYDNSGNLNWSNIIPGSGGEDKAWGIVVDAAENVYITGYITVSGNDTDYYTAKLSNGNIVWAKIYGGNETDKAWGIVVDTDGSVYVTGEATDASHNVNYVTIKYTPDGTQAWATLYDGTGGPDEASAIAILQNQNLTKSIVVTGKSWGTASNYDYATVRYNTDGVQTGQNRYSFTGNSNDMAKDLAISPTKKVIVTGFSSLIIDNSADNSYISTQSLEWGSELTNLNNTPKTFLLEQNYPNPFNPSTNIKFNLTSSGNVKLVVYDMLGKVVDILVNQDLQAGSYNIKYSNTSLSSGIYFYELTTSGLRDIKKMTLVK